MSHHGHQEIVKGITTEYSGKDLAVIEVTHWYEVIFSLTLVYLFFATVTPLSKVFAIIACALVYLFEIILDNSEARVKWQHALNSAWIVTGVMGTINLFILSFFR
ncbi:MAG TPA: NADH-quinone oxidoreductase subunit H [Clostridia bacterium]|nr:NADH-quinone oxidoreductase subunit H [Clostridia bacterium]